MNDPENVQQEESPNLPARRAPELDAIARLGTWLAAVESKRDDVATLGAAAAYRIHAVEELGLRGTWAAQELSIIRGKLVASAKLKRALVERAGYRVERRDDSDESCTAVLIRRETGEVIGSYTFTIEMAKKAGYVRADSGWQKEPARMLWARVSTRVIDDFAPSIALGIYIEEDLDELVRDDETLDVDAEDIPFGEEYATPDELGELAHEGEEPKEEES
jgi:hypothetical protein